MLWLWSMYMYVRCDYRPDALAGHRLDDGIGHLGAWGGVLLCGQVFLAARR